MSEERTAFEAGFLGEKDTPTSRTGEYRLGHVTAEGLSRELADELEAPDELTVKRRLRALKKRTSRKSTVRPFATSGYPLAMAAVIVLAVVIGVNRFTSDDNSCGSIVGSTIVGCGLNQRATLASIERAFPGTTLVQALQKRVPVAAPVNVVDQALSSVGASYILFEAQSSARLQTTHSLVVATHSEDEFDKVTESLGRASATLPVAQELARIKQEERPDWGGTSPHHSVVSLININ